jgi:hypothetical protein
MIKRYYILNNVEKLFYQMQQPEHLSGTMALKTAAEWMLAFERECQAAVQTIKEIRYELSEKELIRYIQLIYRDLIALIDRMRRFEHDFPQGVHEEIFSRLIPMLEVVLHYLESISDRCYEPAQRVPDHQFKLRVEELRLQSLVLRAKFRSKTIDADLQAVVLGYLEGFMRLKSSSYQQLHYTQELLTELIDSLSTAAEGDLTKFLILKLIVLNFNSYLYYNYCKHRLAFLMTQEPNPKMQISRLRYFSKEVQTCIAITKSAMDSNAETVKQSLTNLLDAEIRYRECKSETIGREASQQMGAAAISTGEKLVLNSNMHQLALIIGILSKMNAFLLDKSGMKGLLGFFVRHVSTIGSKDLSIISLQKRVSDRNSPACLSLLALLEQMIVILKRDFLS